MCFSELSACQHVDAGDTYSWCTRPYCYVQNTYNRHTERIIHIQSYNYMSSLNRTYTRHCDVFSCVAEYLCLHRTQRNVGLPPVIPAVDSAYRARRACRRDCSDPRRKTTAANTHAAGGERIPDLQDTKAKTLLVHAQSCITFGLSLYHYSFF